MRANQAARDRGRSEFGPWIVTVVLGAMATAFIGLLSLVDPPMTDDERYEGQLW